MQFCIIAGVDHLRVIDNEILGFFPPVSAGSCSSGDRGWLLVAIIGHGTLARAEWLAERPSQVVVRGLGSAKGPPSTGTLIIQDSSKMNEMNHGNLSGAAARSTQTSTAVQFSYQPQDGDDVGRGQ